MQDCNLDDIYSCDETGLLFRTMPTKSYVEKSDKLSLMVPKVPKNVSLFCFAATCLGLTNVNHWSLVRV